MALLQVKDLSIELRGPTTSHIIFPEVSFELESGDTLAVVGDSGAGKTSLLNAIAGFIRPAGRGQLPDGAQQALTEFLPVEPGKQKERLYMRGSVLVCGVDVTRLPPQKRDVGMLMQSFAVFEDRSVLDNLTFKAMIHGVPRKQRSKEAAGIFDQLDFEGKAQEMFTREASRLSGGEKQRVALGRLIIERPTIWLLDEPYANLDVVKREKISRQVQQQLAKFSNSNVAVCALVVCHDLAETRRAGNLLVLADDRHSPQFAYCERGNDKFTVRRWGPGPAQCKSLLKWIERLKSDDILE